MGCICTQSLGLLLGMSGRIFPAAQPRSRDDCAEGVLTVIPGLLQLLHLLKTAQQSH